MTRSQMTFRNEEKSSVAGKGKMAALAISPTNEPFPTSLQTVALPLVVQCAKDGLVGAVSSWKRVLTVPAMKPTTMTKRTMSAPARMRLSSSTPRRRA